MSGTLFSPPPIDRKKMKKAAQKMEIEDLILMRRRIINEIRKFEEKYGLESEDFYTKWSEGLIPEPEDPDVHGDFLIWSALVEELHRIDKRLSGLLRE